MDRKMKWQILLISAFFSLILGGCQRKQNQANTKEIIIPVTFLVNSDTGENQNESLVKQFNKTYKGVYQLKVDWITDTPEGYRSRMKTMNALDKLPAIVTDVGFDADFYDLLIQNGRLVNLLPYIDKQQDWKNAIGREELKKFTAEDGNIYISPTGNATMSYAGFYYNKELFRQAGINNFPDNWKKLRQCLKALAKNQITPLAIHGGSSYWTPLLIATGFIADTKSGRNFLEQQYPLDYKCKSSADLFTFLKELYQYADQDALTIERTESTQRFLSGLCAIMANGGWMIEDMTKDEREQFGFAPFPGNIMMKDLWMSGWAVTSGYDQEVTEGAIKLLEFRAWQEQKKEDAYMSKSGESVVEREYKNALNEVQQVFPNYQLKWEAGIQEEFFVNMLPTFVEGEIELKTFLVELSRQAEYILSEK